jgi:hypothetical protein
MFAMTILVAFLPASKSGQEFVRALTGQLTTGALAEGETHRAGWTNRATILGYRLKLK